MSGFWYEIGRMQTAGGAIFQGRAESTSFVKDFYTTDRLPILPKNAMVVF